MWSQNIEKMLNLAINLPLKISLKKLILQFLIIFLAFLLPCGLVSNIFNIFSGVQKYFQKDVTHTVILAIQKKNQTFSQQDNFVKKYIVLLSKPWLCSSSYPNTFYWCFYPHRLRESVSPVFVYEALQASAMISVSQRGTNFCSMVEKKFWINFGTQSMLRHTAFRIPKKKCGL